VSTSQSWELRNQPQALMVRPMLVTDYFGPWYGKITPVKTPLMIGGNFEVTICRDILSPVEVEQSSSSIWPGPPIPWIAHSLREAKRIVKREIRNERRDEKRRAKRLAVGVIRVEVGNRG
jgi:hypothetical protein